MKNLNFKAVLPILVAIVIFLILTFGYFAPLLKNKVIVQSDMVFNKGMAKELVDYRQKNKSEALWTNSMFGGMPAYQISVAYHANLIAPLRGALMLWMPTPANMVFTYMMGFFFLLLVLRVDRWLSIVGAIAFGFSAFFFIIIDAGHNTQALAIGYMAPVFAGVILVCRGQYLLGGAVTALFMAVEVNCNHVQITYYLVLAMAIYVLFEWVSRIRKKDYAFIWKSFSVFMIAGILSITTNITSLWSTYEYAKSTIRGPSELTSDKENKTTGLDIDYATAWSMGKAETMTLLIPGFKGRTSNAQIGENKKALKDVEPQMKEMIGSMPQYWGDQPFTMSPYAGAIVVFLFIFGLFVVQGRMKWALVTITIVGILLAWGKNLMPLTEFFLNYFPGYNKFRAVSMILVLAEFAMPILAVLALDKMFRNPKFMTEKFKTVFGKEVTGQTAMFISFGLTGGLSLLFYLFPGLTDFSSVNDTQVYDQVAKSNGNEIAARVLENLETAREALFRADALRSFFFVLLGAGLVWMFMRGIIKKALFIPLLGIVILFDLVPIDKVHLSDKNFSTNKEAKVPFPMTAADKEILADPDPNYRVLNIAVNTFNDASTSYYHKSIGGYHAVKLRRYQELIDAHIQNNIQSIISTLRSNPTDSSLRVTFSQQGVLNMLNMRYLIYSPDAPPIRNRFALGNAWFVKEVKMVKNADEELKAIGEVDPAVTAVVDQRYANELEGFQPKPDPSASIRLTSYVANHLKYESNAASEQLAVFSEIYFKDGWNAYVDGELKPHFNADWVLRAMRVPAGKHVIEFKFEPRKFFLGEKISMISGIILFLGLIISLYLAYRRKQAGNSEEA
jgi:hypothetical protein